MREDRVPKYNKTEVIELANKITPLYMENRTLERWMDDIIEILNSSRAQKVLEWHKETDRGDYFLNQEMNINYKLNPDGKREYKFNLITAITLATLLMLYDDCYFQDLLKNRFASVAAGEVWFDKAEKKMEEFQDYWEEQLRKGILVEVNGRKQKEERSWDIISINILSQLYKLTVPEINKDYIEKMDEELQKFTDKFLSLDDDSKNKTFEKIKTRLVFMDDELEKVVKNMKYEEKFEYNTNLQLKKGNHGLKDLN